MRIVASDVFHSQGHSHRYDRAVDHNVAGGAAPKDNAICLNGVQLAEPGLVADGSVVRLHVTSAVVHSDLHRLGGVVSVAPGQPRAGAEKGV